MAADTVPECFGEYLEYRQQPGCTMGCRHYEHCIAATRKVIWTEEQVR